VSSKNKEEKQAVRVLYHVR